MRDYRTQKRPLFRKIYLAVGWLFLLASLVFLVGGFLQGGFDREFAGILFLATIFGTVGGVLTLWTE